MTKQTSSSQFQNDQFFDILPTSRFSSLPIWWIRVTGWRTVPKRRRMPRETIALENISRSERHHTNTKKQHSAQQSCRAKKGASSSTGYAATVVAKPSRVEKTCTPIGTHKFVFFSKKVVVWFENLGVVSVGLETKSWSFASQKDANVP